MIACLQPRGLSERTQESYVRGVRQLSEHYHIRPDMITEGELRRYFLVLRHDGKSVPNLLTARYALSRAIPLSETLQRYRIGVAVGVSVGVGVAGFLQPALQCAW